MPFTLGQSARTAGYRVAAFDTIGSTNTEALARARAGDPGRLWVAALEQSAGRGRRGRAWSTRRGNLAATCLEVLGPGASRRAPTLGFVAGLALHEALTGIAPQAAARIGLDAMRGGGARFELKWPNDLLADGAKLAGILLESETLGDGQVAAVAGIGVNVISAPDDLPYRATSLRALGVTADAESLFAPLTDAWLGFIELWDEGRGIAEIRRRWLGVAAGLGEPAIVRLDGRVIRGTFETIDESGALVIRTADGGTETIAAGEVHFGAMAMES